MPNICGAKYRLTREELLKAMRHHNRIRFRLAFLVIMKICAAALLVLIVLAIVAWIVDPPTSLPPFWAMLAVAAVSLYWLFYDKINAWNWSRGFSKRPDANSEIEWQFSDEKIETQNALVTATLAWKSFFKVVETSDGFLFYPVKNIFYWLPFSAFDSSECVAKVRQLIADNGY